MDCAKKDKPCPDPRYILRKPMNLVLIESAAIAVSAILSIHWIRMYLGKKKISGDIDYGMQVIAKEAVNTARKGFKVDLDFSPSSIDRLEEMLGKIHERHLQKPLNEKELAVHSIRWGAYIGEVLRRVRPGKWYRDSEKVGPGTIPFIYDSGEQAFPRSWVYKRIVDGEFDNVATKFRLFSDPAFIENSHQGGDELQLRGDASE
jgi:hypothetical protein